jgi:hypothetical protein
MKKNKEENQVELEDEIIKKNVHIDPNTLLYIKTILLNSAIGQGLVDDGLGMCIRAKKALSQFNRVFEIK